MNMQQRSNSSEIGKAAAAFMSPDHSSIQQNAKSMAAVASPTAYSASELLACLFSPSRSPPT